MIVSRLVTTALAAIATVAVAPAHAQRTPPVVAVAVVQQTAIAPTLAVPGTVYSRNEAELMAAVAGRLEFVAEPGTELAAGEPIARIDTTMLRLERAEQEALLRRAKIQTRQLESEYRRQAELSASSVVSEFQLEQTMANRDLARADADIIAVRIRQIDERIRRAAVRAPFAGVVTERMRRIGEEVAPGAPLAAMTDLSQLEVRAFVPLKHINRIDVGESLTIFNADARVVGTIRALVPTGDIRSQTFEARIDIEAATELNVGELVSVGVPIRAAEQALAVPRDALVLRSDGRFVFRISADNVAERVAVELGDSVGDLIAVRGALQEGDQVAIRGGETLTDGASVRLAES
ncbi:MAG: efflux RND transporter periplasmic adaptor subunit [Pseudomonadota bacterium]